MLIDFRRVLVHVALWFVALMRERRLRLTAVTAFELRMGADYLPRRSEISRLFRARTLALDTASAWLAGEVALARRAAGQPIGLADCLQAGICLCHRLPLATRNSQQLGRAAGLDLLDAGALAAE